MALPIVVRPAVIDLWTLAADKLDDEDRHNIDFSRPDKLNAVADLTKLVQTYKEKCIKKRWRYTRKSGETVIFGDLFGKLIKWIDLFKQVGDVVIQ